MDNKNLVIGLSILRINKNTIPNLEKLSVLSQNNQDIQVVVFNKSTENLLNRTFSEHLHIENISYESLYETIMRFEISDEQQFLWLNDDDEIHIDENSEILKPIFNQLVLPSMKLKTDYGVDLVDWDQFLSSSAGKQRYEAYWRIAAPLIFCSIPGKIVNVWISYLRMLPIYLPHLDTQLNVLACLVKSAIKDKNYEYVYDAGNWQDSTTMENSSIRHAVSLGLEPLSASAFPLARKIDDVIISQIAVNNNIRGSKRLRRRLLMQFTPIQGNGINFIKRNLFTRKMRLRHIEKISISKDEFDLIQRLPKKSKDYLVGYRNIRSMRRFAEILRDKELAAALHLPEELIKLWATIAEGEAKVASA